MGSAPGDVPNFTVRSEARSQLAVAQIVDFDIERPTDRVSVQNSYRLDMSLTGRPANSRARFRDRWGEGRFQALGSIYLVPPREPVVFRSEAGRTTSLVCELEPLKISEFVGEDIVWSDAALEKSFDLASPRTQQVLRLMGEELLSPGFASRVMIDALSLQLAIELGRVSLTVRDKAKDRGLLQWQLKAIDEYIRCDANTITLPGLARICNLSVRHLSRRFRLSRGCTIGQYVAQVRVERAAAMLRLGRSIKAISRDLGFTSTAGFSQAFKRSTGSSPSSYRSHQDRARWT